MGFKQLYYTSCERGLSGYPGYQFNAVTPGVDPEVMREVERLTAYEPPRSLGFEPSEAEIAACPVNLCFAPGEDATIVASVAFVGADFSHRFGNYFAHALATTTPEQDFGALLPIELWQAPFWRRRVADSLELAELTSTLAPGPIDRAAAAAFAAAPGAAAERLGALLSAAALAVGGAGRSVVVVDADADRNAHRIALLSYLLPPTLVRRMSFTTYNHRPSYCELHVIGALPGDDFDLSDDPLSSFYLFDYAGDRFSDVEVHPAAALLARAGVDRTTDIWRRAAAIRTGGETTLDDWHPLIAVVGAAEGVDLGGDDYQTAINWFRRNARGLSHDDGDWVGSVLLDQEAFDHRHVGDLIAAASASGAASTQKRLDEIERRVVDRALDQVLEGGRERSPVVRLASAVATAHTKRRCEEALAKADLATGAALLEWADRSGVELGGTLLAAWGKRVVAPVLLREPSHQHARRVAERRPDLLRGVVSYLAVAAEHDPEVVTAALESGLTSFLPEAEVTAHPRLRELLALDHARRVPAARMEALCEILALRGSHSVDPGLLRRLWPNGQWSLSEARRAVELLSDQQLTGGELPQWLGDAVANASSLGDRVALIQFLDLCNKLHQRGLRHALPKAARERLKEASWVGERLEAAKRNPRRTGAATAELASHYPTASEPIRSYLDERLPALIADSARVEDLAQVLSACPRPLLRLYLDRVDPQLRRYSPDPPVAARLFQAMVALRASGHPYGQKIDQDVLRASLPSWKRRDLDQVASLLRRQSARLSQEFTRWWGSYASRGGPGRRLGGAIKELPGQVRNRFGRDQRS
jgi:hypothetical protein